MKAFSGKYSVVILNYKNKSDEIDIELIQPRKGLVGNIPVYSGRAKFHYKKGRLRPERYWLEYKGNQTFLDPKEFMNLIRNSKQVLIPKNVAPPFVKELRSMFRDFRIDMSKIREVNLCRYCLFDGYRITDLGKKNYEFQGEKVCLRCARNGLIRELQYRGIDVDRRLSGHVDRMLKRDRSVERVLGFLASGVNVNQPSATLYDVIPPFEPPEEMRIAHLDLPQELKEIWQREGIDWLLPAQVKAIRNGLLEGESILIVSATSSGKTLIGELAGVFRALKRKTFCFLVPLVALANQLYEEFRRKYEDLGLRAAIRVGMSKIDTGEEELVVVDSDISQADIIVGTYEGFDFLLRSGNSKDIGDIGTVVIDEIQMLADEDRGIEVDGLISRLKSQYPNCQFIGLSATVGNPKQLAEKLNLKLVEHKGRPVPLERHLIVTVSESEKLKAIDQLIHIENQHISSSGYPGQTLVFTNSRRKTQEISDWLSKRNLRVTSYHAGMTYARRKSTEELFAEGEYQSLVTTYALGAGFNAPVSQVVFESLMMGKDYLTNAMFNQMLGRAGRLGKHDRGKVVLLVEPGRKYFGKQNVTEDKIAVELLDGEVEDVVSEPEFESVAEQVLASICTQESLSISALDKVYNLMLGPSIDLADILKFLEKRGFIKKENGKILPTDLGKMGSISFLKPSDITFVHKNLGKTDPLELAIKLEPFKSAYLSDNLVAELSRAFNTHFPSRLFADWVLNTMEIWHKRRRSSKISRKTLRIFSKWVLEIFDCRCKDNPYCDCGQITLSKKLIDLRMNGLTPKGISYQLLKEYEIYAYPGDIFNWFDSLIHSLKAVQRIAEVSDSEGVAEDIDYLIKSIETPFILSD